MQNILKTCLIALLCVGFSVGYAQTQKYVYTVQIGTFIGAKIDDFNVIRPYGFIYADQLDEKLHQIYIGEFVRESDAEALLKTVKEKGYLDAYVTQRSIDQGQEVRMIQLATKGTKEPINWARYLNAGNLYVHLDNNSIKILTGIFTSENVLRSQLQNLKPAGFKDAFAKTVNSKLLHRISEFETNGSVILPSSQETVVALPPESTTSQPETEKEEFSSKGSVPPPVVIPAEYDNINFRPRSASAFKPTIRKNVKRTSSLELQKLMKDAKTYSGSLDGLYGPGTASAYDKLMNSNRQLQKYTLLARFMPPSLPSENNSALQKHINTLAEDTPAAMDALAKINHPLAKAYQAYVLFVQGNNQTRVNQLMNEAIKETFVGKTVTNQAPFDYRASYAYTDLNQLILHLSFIHNAQDDHPALPCWLVQRHPSETNKAFEPYATMSSKGYNIQDCGGFMEWEELRLLHSIAADLYTGGQLNQTNLRTLQNERARLYLMPKALNKYQKSDIENWNVNLWTTLDEWAESDPLHAELITTLKVAYFQSAVLLEDYFMDKGLKYTEAKPLALLSLKTVVAPYLESFF